MAGLLNRLRLAKPENQMNSFKSNMAIDFKSQQHTNTYTCAHISSSSLLKFKQIAMAEKSSGHSPAISHNRNLIALEQ